MASMPDVLPESVPTRRQRRRWRRYLADEHAEAAVYRDLATRRTGEEREILLALADAEGRHAAHWETLLGPDARPARRDPRTSVLGWFARRFGSVFTLALIQRAESRSDYEADADATRAMAADERIHEEVVRSLASRGRQQISGNFRAAVFGANDGLVSNLALILGVGATGVSSSVVLVTGIAGLLAGALSMGAGEYVSVRSQRELADASTPSPHARAALPHLDVDANELSLVYRARGMDPEAAQVKARAALADVADGEHAHLAETPAGDGHDLLGTAWGAAGASFCFFATGAFIPILPYLLGLSSGVAFVLAVALVGIALLATGATVGILSGASPLRRALRQVAIGYGAAGVTYVVGLLFGTSVA
jgi:VIT1/CCC1 family predicted Fe2+/Mn2+ transporter